MIYSCLLDVLLSTDSRDFLFVIISTGVVVISSLFLVVLSSPSTNISSLLLSTVGGGSGSKYCESILLHIDFIILGDNSQNTIL